MMSFEADLLTFTKVAY